VSEPRLVVTLMSSLSAVFAPLFNTAGELYTELKLIALTYTFDLLLRLDS